MNCSSSLLSLNKQCCVFSLGEIKFATHDFDDDLVIGKGGFGNVTKANMTFWLKLMLKSRGRIWISIKEQSSCGQRLRCFPTFVIVIYCEESGNREMILVYEYMSNGSSYDHLHKNRANRTNSSPLTWVQMLNICVGAARGLDYLYTGTSVQFRVIHHDVKSSNIFLNENLEAKISTLGYRELVLHISHALLLMFILVSNTDWLDGPNSALDKDYNAKLLDFVLAKLGPHNGESHVTTHVAGTYDFMAPEYISTGHIYIKSDVYSFAMVMLEIITALRAMVAKRYGWEQNLLDWGRPFFSGTSGSLLVLFPFFFGALSLAGTDGAG
uniref:Serine/threonine/dual specificity protein kinase, catalytic domain-containing protein n=1 Tax=Tanacetum cinerariifolium TaxID=118510 RepID=A0A6L2KXZ3_TANCI|nr:serine/threonine/dual specificity protein kinase, catalytic domain-containing protein [Tanacetum cinerariifolium]